MFDLIKKTLLTGTGLVVMTKEKIQELVGELVKKGEVSEKEGRELVTELLKKSEQAGKELEAKVEGLVGKAVAKVNVATKDDIAKLATRIKRLERKRKKEDA